MAAPTHVVFKPDLAGIARMAAPGGMVDVWMLSMAEAIAAVAKGLAPRQSGALADSISTERADGSAWTVVADVPYSLAVHEGTAPHPIEAVNAKVLRFPTKGGTIVYTPRVQHPGTSPNPFLEKAMLSVLGKTLT